MTRADVFMEVGGLSRVLPINFNDIDYCLKVHESGRRIVYDPDLILFHFESSSRDPVVNEWEIMQLVDRWRHVAAVDPYGNPNLVRGIPRLKSHLDWMRGRRPRLRRRQPA
jgi:GT2 family glycosyltransferase